MIITFFAGYASFALHAHYYNDIVCWLCILPLHAHFDNDILCVVMHPSLLHAYYDSDIAYW